MLIYCYTTFNSFIFHKKKKTHSSDHGYVRSVSKYLFRVGTYVASFVSSMSPKYFFS